MEEGSMSVQFDGLADLGAQDWRSTGQARLYYCICSIAFRVSFVGTKGQREKNLLMESRTKTTESNGQEDGLNNVVQWYSEENFHQILRDQGPALLKGVLHDHQTCPNHSRLLEMNAPLAASGTLCHLTIYLWFEK